MELLVYHLVIPLSRTQEMGPGVGGERRYSKALISQALLGKLSGLGVSRAWPGSAQQPRNASSAAPQQQVGGTRAWAPGGTVHFPAASASFSIPTTWAACYLLGRSPGEVDTVVFGIPPALNSPQFFPYLRKVKLPCPWEGGSDINSIVA